MVLRRERKKIAMRALRDLFGQVVHVEVTGGPTMPEIAVKPGGTARERGAGHAP